MRLFLAFALLILPAVSFAAVPAVVTSALSDASSGVLSVGGLVVGIVVALLAFRLMRRCLDTGSTGADFSDLYD